MLKVTQFLVCVDSLPFGVKMRSKMIVFQNQSGELVAKSSFAVMGATLVTTKRA